MLSARILQTNDEFCRLPTFQHHQSANEKYQATPKFVATILNTNKSIVPDERQLNSSSNRLTELTTERQTLIPDSLVKCQRVHKATLTKCGFRDFRINLVLLKAT